MKTERTISFLQLMTYTGLAAGLLVLTYLILNAKLPVSLVFAAVPFGILVVMLLLRYPYLALLSLFVLNYFIIAIARYAIAGLKAGVVIDGMIAVVIVGLLIFSFKNRLPWQNLRNGLTLAVSLWFFYCLFHILNPLGPFETWLIGIRRTALYFFAFPVLTFLLFNRYKDFKIIIIIWSVCVLLAVLKALMQKYLGFDTAEMKFLYLEGKARTHIIYSGIRYFSFFTDAANFGCAMAFAMVFFSISALFIENRILQTYFVTVSVFAGLGMLMSGTRVAIAIPFTGYALFAVLSRNYKIITGGAVLLLTTYIFLSFTNIGQGNSYIRRMRTAFHPQKDASFVVRMENQERMKAYLADKPFGVGLGTSKASGMEDELSKIPTDSWLVMIWVETGIVGLILYLCLILFIFAKGIYIILFKIKNKELWGLECALLSGMSGMFVASYANEVIAQFPNGPIIYTAMAFVFMAERFERDIINGKKDKLTEHGGNTRNIDY